MSETLDVLATPAHSNDPAMDDGAAAADNQVSGMASSAASPATAKPVVAMLRNARMPVDHGLSSLGLLMQLGGTIGIALTAVLAIAATLLGMGAGTGLLFLFAVLSGVRSAFHRAAGTSLLYGEGTAPLRGVRTYILISVVQSIVCLVCLAWSDSHIEVKSMVQFGALLLGWPITLLVYFSQSHIRALLRKGVPDSEDHGFEGAAVLMTLFGIMGALFAGLVLTGLLDDPGAAFMTPAAGLLVLIFAVLVARSIIHALAGFKGISGADFDQCNAAAARYYHLGIASSVVIGGILFLVLFMSPYSLGDALVAGVFTWSILMIWPTILRRLYAERNFHVFLAGADAPTFQRAPDAGLIALGWTFVALAVFALGRSLGEALFATPLGPDEAHALAIMTAGSDVRALVERSAWWSVGISGLQLWAGIELLRMSPRHKLAAMIYGAITIMVTLYQIWPIAGKLDSLFTDMVSRSSTVLISNVFSAAAGFNLILAIAAIVLVNRVTVPSAVVHIRKQRRPARNP